MRSSPADRLGPFLRRSLVGHLLAVAAVLTAGHLALHRPRPLPPSVEVRLVKELARHPTAPKRARAPRPAVRKAPEKRVVHPKPKPKPKPVVQPKPKPKPVVRPKPKPRPKPRPKPKPRVVHPKPKAPDHALVNEKQWEEKSLADIRRRLRARREKAKREEAARQRREAERRRQEEARRQREAEAARLEQERKQLAETIARIKEEEAARVAAARAAAERERRLAAAREAAEARAVEVAERHRATYQGVAGRIIKGNFTLPPNVPKESHLVTKVRVRVDLNGELLDVVLEAPSGNRYFDDAVMRAVRKSAPLPRPPDDLSLLDSFDGTAVTLYFQFDSDLL